MFHNINEAVVAEWLSLPTHMQEGPVLVDGHHLFPRQFPNLNIMGKPEPTDDDPD